MFFARTSRLLVAWVGLTACNANLDLPTHADIACTSDSECPGEKPVCSARGRCTNPLVNLPPTLVVNVAPVNGRHVDSVNLDVSIADPNGAPDGNDTSTLTVRYAVGATGTWYTASVIGETNALASSLGGTLHSIAWDLVGNASGAQELILAPGDQDGDGVFERQMVLGLDNLFLEVDAQDQSGALASTVRIGPLWVGNSAPLVTLQPVVEGSGAIILAFVVMDADNDLVDVEIEFRDVNDALGFRKTDIVVGELLHLVPRQAPYQVAWQSNSQPHADPSIAQGLGPVNTAGVEVRARARDHVGDNVFYGPWSSFDSLWVNNQTPPQVAAASLVNVQPDGVLGVVGIAYRLADAEGELANVNVEHSTDGGATWHPCTEYPIAQSEGVRNLTTTIAGSANAGEHLFVWDTTADIVQQRGARLRITPTHANTPGTPVELDVGVVGHIAGLSSNYFASPWSNLFGQRPIHGTLQTARLNSDNKQDILYLTAQGNGSLSAMLPTNLSETPPDGVTTRTYSEPYAQALATGLFDNNDLHDVATVAASPSRLSVRLASSASPDNPLQTNVTYTLADLSPQAVGTGDVDGDDNIDIVVSGLTATTEQALVVFLGDGAGAFVESPARYALSSGHAVAAVVDLDGDGRADVLTTAMDAIDDVNVLTGLGRANPSDEVLAPARSLSLQAMGTLRGGDFDGDGLVDISGTRSTDVFLALGRGLNTLAAGFDEIHVASLPLPIVNMRWLDGDGDLRMDLWLETSADFWLFRGSAGNVVQPGPALNDGTGFSCYNGAIAVAASGGKPEIFVSHRSQACSYVYDGSGAPVFDSSTFYSWQQVVPAWDSNVKLEVGGRAQRLVDLNHDGLLDRMHLVPPHLWVQLAHGRLGFATGTYAPAQHYLLGVDGMLTTDALLGDFNGDGAQDIVAWRKNNNHTEGLVFVGELLGGVPTGSFVSATSVWTPSPATLVPLDAGDLDGDGDDDLITTEGVILAQFESASPFSVATPLALASVETARIGHLNGDDIPDFVVTWYDSPWDDAPGRYVAAIDGATGEIICPPDVDSCGATPCQTLITSLEHVDETRLADLNADGRLDFVWVVHRFSDTSLRGLTRNTDDACKPFAGAFGLFISSHSTAAHTSDGLVISDINGDGALDILRANGETAPVVLYGEQIGGVGSGFISGSAVDLPLGATFAVVPADTDGDGLLNLTATAGSGFSLVRSRQSRANPFSPLSEAVAAADWVGDVAAFDTLLRLIIAPMLPNSAGIGSNPVSLYSLAHDSALVAEWDPQAWTPLTHSWSVEGDVQAQRVVLPSGQERVRLAPRFGPQSPGQSAGLDLANSDGLGVRGIVIHLPIPSARQATLAGKPVVLLARERKWRRASELASDALFGTAQGDEFLPSVLRGGAWQPVWQPTYHWRVIERAADNDLSTANGEAFAIMGTEVVVKVDKLGAFQALLQP